MSFQVFYRLLAIKIGRHWPTQPNLQWGRIRSGRYRRPWWYTWQTWWFKQPTLSFNWLACMGSHSHQTLALQPLISSFIEMKFPQLWKGTQSLQALHVSSNFGSQHHLLTTNSNVYGDNKDEVPQNIFIYFYGKHTGKVKSKVTGYLWAIRLTHPWNCLLAPPLNGSGCQ